MRNYILLPVLFLLQICYVVMINSCIRCNRLLGNILNNERSLNVALQQGNKARCLSTSELKRSRKLMFPRLTQDNVNMQKRLQIKYPKDFIEHKVEEYKLGTRRLARMMGQDPNTFTEDDVNNAIRYLFPSDLFSLGARPQMQHPDKIYPIAQEVETDDEGRPLNSLFYTNYFEIYSIMSEAHDCIVRAQQLHDSAKPKDIPSPLKLNESRWMTMEELETFICPYVSLIPSVYDSFISQMERLLEEPFASSFKDFIMRYRVELPRQTVEFGDVSLQTDESGRKYTCADGKRKTAIASVKLIDGGQGRITINGVLMQDFFNMMADRECLITPLVFLGVYSRFDVEATVDGGFAGNWSMLNGSINKYPGTCRSAIAGSIRLALAKALVPFINETRTEQMRRAGLLSYDPRRRERKKPGQKKARKKFTWKKR